MGIPTESSFSKFKMTDSEAMAASIFTVMQEQHIHNMRVDVAETWINLEDDVEHPLKTVQERARFQGMLDAYAGLINVSIAAKSAAEQLNSGR